MMPKCPFCGKEITHLYVCYREYVNYSVYLNSLGDLEFSHKYTESGELVGYPICPYCLGEIPIHNDDDNTIDDTIRDFLKGKYIVLRSDDSEIKAQKDNFIIFEEKIYKIVERRPEQNLLILKLVEDEVVSDILKADLESE